MFLSLDVLVGHLITLKTLLLPVELKVDVSGDSRDWQVLISQFHNFTLNVSISHTLQIRVQMEVCGHLFVGKLRQRLNLIRGESIAAALLGACDRLCDVSVFEGRLLLRLLGLLLCSFS